jgi:hypothetical protein
VIAQGLPYRQGRISRRPPRAVAGHQRRAERRHGAYTEPEQREQASGHCQRDYPVPGMKNRTSASLGLVHAVIPFAPAS